MMHLRLYNPINWLVLIFLFFVSCRKPSEFTPITEHPGLTPYDVKYPYYFPQLKIPLNNPLSIEGIQLGRRLYYDSILSNNGQSCSSCHNAQSGFSTFTSNSLPHVNLGWNTNFLWNGKVSTGLEDIMRFEVDLFFKTNITKLNQSAFYQKAFKQVFNTDQITSTQVAFVLAQFFRAMISDGSPFDQYVQHKIMFTPSQLRGLEIFSTEKGDCFHCHTLGLFTDNQFHNIGIDTVFDGTNSGRYAITLNPKDRGLFKTPTLRNIQLTAPYMHDGRFSTLEEVIDHYNEGVQKSTTIDPIMTKSGKEYGLGLTTNEKQDLLEFLKTLTDTIFIKNPLFQKP